MSQVNASYNAYSSFYKHDNNGLGFIQCNCYRIHLIWFQCEINNRKDSKFLYKENLIFCMQFYSSVVAIVTTSTDRYYYNSKCIIIIQNKNIQ